MTSNTRSVLLIGLILWLVVLGAAGAWAASDRVRVGIRPFEPFVILDGEAPRGISIDTWEALNTHFGVDYEFVICDGVAEKLQKLGAGEIDIAIGGLTITEDREEHFDFSHPVFNTGLDILLPVADNPTLRALAASLFRGDKPILLGSLLVLLVIAGHMIWLVERSSDTRTTSFDRRYFPGVLEGIYWALITASTVGYGDKVPKKWPGQVVTGVIILTFLPIFGYFVAQLSADITMYKLRTDIRGPQDLDRKQVAVVADTTSHAHMRSTHADLAVFAHARQAYKALAEGQVDAVVYDAPQLQYFAHHEGRGTVKVVGRLFAPQDYGLALPPGSPRREKLNRAILAMKESGDLQKIQGRWFGP
ncbi:MAG: transporter substrate-binding domain-containing protein [Desulfosarcina sp.]|nr:transporter substrate-binding domain-containing protein [Desulfobacterales bacterium]